MITAGVIILQFEIKDKSSEYPQKTWNALGASYPSRGLGNIEGNCSGLVQSTAITLEKTEIYTIPEIWSIRM